MPSSSAREKVTSIASQGSHAAHLMQASRSTHSLASRELPEVHRLGAEMRAAASLWCGNGLALILRAHVGSLDAMRFELLVAQGLRSAPNHHDREAFRLQVEDVTTCTHLTWLHLRDFLVQDAPGDSLDPLTGDFIMAARGAQREVAKTLESVEYLARGLDGREQGANSDASRLALSELKAKARAQRERLLAMQPFCAAARDVQRAAYAWADEKRALRGVLGSLGTLLSGGLLVRLRVLVEPTAWPTAQEVQEAARERERLTTPMRQSMLQLARLRESHEVLLQRLEAMCAACRAV